MPGRKPIPTKLRLLRGNPGKRTINKKEPQGKVELAKRPGWIKRKAQTLWESLGETLLDTKVITLSDRVAFEQLCSAYEQWRTARDFILKHGLTYEHIVSVTDEGEVFSNPRKRPEVDIESDNWKRLKAMMVEFGLTPSSRTKIERLEEATFDPMEDFLHKARTNSQKMSHAKKRK